MSTANQWLLQMYSVCTEMGVSKNKGTPKWMIYNGQPYQKMYDLGGPPLFLETPK